MIAGREINTNDFIEYSDKIPMYDDLVQTINLINKNSNKYKIELNESDNKIIITSTNNYCPLSIKNDNLNCSLSSILHSIGAQRYGSNSFLSELHHRYKTLTTIQQFYNDYQVLPEDVLILLDKAFYHKTESENLSKKRKIINFESEIANIIERLNNCFQISNLPLKQKMENKIRKCLEKLNNINIQLHNEPYNKDIGLNKLCQSNMDPAETLDNIIEYLSILSRNYKFTAPILPIYCLSYSNGKYKILNNNSNTLLSNNIIINCSGLFDEYNNINTLNTARIKDFINKHIPLALIDNKTMNLNSINVAFFDTELKTVFHHAALVKNDDNKWMLIDPDKEHNNKEITIYNSLEEVFCNDNELCTALIDNVGKVNYRLFPTLLFYNNIKYNNNINKSIYILESKEDREITWLNKVNNNMLQELNNEINALEQKIKDKSNLNNDDTLKVQNTRISDRVHYLPCMNENLLNRGETTDNCSEDSLDYCSSINITANKGNILQNNDTLLIETNDLTYNCTKLDKQKDVEHDYDVNGNKQYSILNSYNNMNKKQYSINVNNKYKSNNNNNLLNRKTERSKESYDLEEFSIFN